MQSVLELLPPTQLEENGQSAPSQAECSHEVNTSYSNREQWVSAAQSVHSVWRQSCLRFKRITVSVWILKLWSICLYADAVLTWSGGWADSLQDAELCDRCLHIRQEGECLSGAFLHSVLTVGSHQLLQSRPELPSLQKSTRGHWRTQLMDRVLLNCQCLSVAILNVRVFTGAVGQHLLCGQVLWD